MKAWIRLLLILAGIVAILLAIAGFVSYATASEPIPREQYPAEIGLYPEDHGLMIPEDFTGTLVVAWGDYQNEYRIENGQIYQAERIEQ